MKNFLLAFCLLFLGIGCKQQTSNVQPRAQKEVNLEKIKIVLDSIHEEDQKYRKEIEGISEKHGWESEEMKAHWNIINKADSSNLVIVEEILNKHGWLSREQVGKTANSTLFLVIQHSDQETQEKYLPMMRKAVKEGQAKAKSLALLEDRVSLGKGELQIYGSQIGTDQETGEYYVLPLINPDSVNERRASVGLGTIEDYISHWDMEWDLEKYKEELPKHIEILQGKK